MLSHLSRLGAGAWRLASGRETTGFLALAAIVGVGVGTGAAGLVLVIFWIGEGFTTLERLAGSRAWWVIPALPLGLLASWWVARRFAPEVEGDGVPDAISALAVHGGMIRGRVVPAKMVATALTLGGGGSGGREGPIVQIGAAVGSVVSRFFRLGEDQIRSLVAAGAGAGIG
ncbi:MAG TPA: chloride channel protein, partial [Acidimicrobiia bacterium]